MSGERLDHVRFYYCTPWSDRANREREERKRRREASVANPVTVIQPDGSVRVYEDQQVRAGALKRERDA